MKTPILLIPLLAYLFNLSACSPVPKTELGKAARNNSADFFWFDYVGNDELFERPLADDQYRNPILAGFHPDPSIVRVDKDYYLVNSTFGFFPGIPVFHSRDLVNWKQIGNAIHRPEQLNYQGLHLGQNGVYAPAIEYRDGTFYIINTCVACGGNFVLTAQNPAGPWSNPIWLPHVGGIDPSIFFDDDGKTYIVHHKNPDPQRYPAHTALWVMQVDPKTFAALSEDVMLVDGGEEAPWHTEYIEGPHIYKVNGRYYLSAAGGGTGYYHGQLVYQSEQVFGPYQPNPNNPFLSQVGLPEDRPHPVTATGHGDLFSTPEGDWWIVFLATRVYDLHRPPQDPGRFHTGRETFMLPVTWQDGWPNVVKDQALPLVVTKPKLPAAKPAAPPLNGNFSLREEFRQPQLAPHWLFIRSPRSQWWQSGNDQLRIQARQERVGDKRQPSFIGRRLAHMKAHFATKMRFAPQSSQHEAGLLAIQNSEHYYAFALSKNTAGEIVLRVRKRAGEKALARGKALVEQSIPLNSGDPVYLRIEIDSGELSFLYSLDDKNYHSILQQADASPLTTMKAGGFTGAVVGMFAETEGSQ